MTGNESDRNTVGRSRAHARQLCLAVVLFLPSTAVLADSITSFTYQGRLRDATGPASGNYDLTFALFDAATNGSQIGSTLTNLDLPVTNGLFSVSLDFGTNAFDGNPRWVEIAVRSDTNILTVLSPRQPITASPYAIAAMSLVSPLQASLLPPNVPKLDASQTFTSSNVFTGPAVFTNAANVFSGAFAGDGSTLSNLTSTAVRRALAWPAAISDTNYLLDFGSDVAQLNAATDINFVQSTNRPPEGCYRECVWYIQPGPTNRVLSFNPAWVPLGTLAANWPCLLMSNKVAVIAFSIRGGSETNVVYAVARQE